MYKKSSIVAALAALALPTATQAATPASLVTACSSKKGALRLAKTCKKGERRIKLMAYSDTAATGPKGDPGAQGPKGDPGAKGDPGSAGAPADPLKAPLVLSAANATDGVFQGVNTATTGATTGLFGEAQSPSNGLGAYAGVSGVLGVAGGGAGVPGGYSAGVRGVNKGTGGTGIGVIGYQGGSGWGVYGETPSGFGLYGLTTDSNAGSIGVRGETFSHNGVAVQAKYSGAGAGVALRITNGKVEVGGLNVPAFRVTVGSRCGVSQDYAVIDKPIVNDDPNAMLFLTHTTVAGAFVGVTDPVGVIYTAANPPLNCPANRWLIVDETGGALPVGAAFNVWVVNT
jgi:hypothetical protein